MSLGSIIYKVSPRAVHFTEQVQLSTGEIIYVDRQFKAKKFGGIGGPGGWEPLYMALGIKSAAKGTLPKWESASGWFQSC